MNDNLLFVSKSYFERYFPHLSCLVSLALADIALVASLELFFFFTQKCSCLNPPKIWRPIRLSFLKDSGKGKADEAASPK